MLLDIKNEIQSAARYFRKEATRKLVVPISRLFIVLDHGGGWRFVVTPYSHIKHHVDKSRGERAIMVPKVRIAEPVEWDDIPRTIKLAERWASKSLAGNNLCGGCRMCCITPPIKEPNLQKPAHVKCVHLDDCVGGCGIYPVRPHVCKAFECDWLISQRVNDRMPLELRPDNCGVMFRSGSPLYKFDKNIVEAHPDVRWPSNPFENEKVKEYIEDITKFGKKVIGVTHYVEDTK